MSKTVKIVLGVVTIIVVIILFSVLFKKNNSNTVKFGEITALTGAFARNGEEIRNSINLAVNEINDNGGVLGKKIEMVIEDGKCDAPSAISAWNKLVSIDKVKFVFGGHCSTESLAIAPLTAKDKVIALANLTTANNVPNEGEWLFRNSPPSDYVAVGAADYIVKDLGFKRIGVFSEIKELPKSYTQTFINAAKKNGAEIVFFEEFAPNTTDFRSQISKIKSNKIDLMFISTQTGETSGILSKQLNEQDIKVAQAFNTSFNYSAFIKGSDGFRPENFIVITGYADPNTDKMKRYLDDYHKTYNNDISFNIYYISAAYDMVYRLKGAMEKCNSTTNVECIRNVFKNTTSYEGVSGTIPVSSQYSPSSALMPQGRLYVENEKVIVKPLK